MGKRIEVRRDILLLSLLWVWARSRNDRRNVIMGPGRFQEDPRYRQANREALIGILLFAANFVWWFVFAYGLGRRPASEYTYVMGFPAWFFYSAIIGWLLFTVLVWVAVRRFFKDMPLEGKGGGSNG